MPAILAPPALALLVLVLGFTAVWLVSLRLQNAGIVDVWWGPAILLATVAYFASADGDATRRGLVLALTAAWAARLAWHLGRRNIGHEEDARYRKWREANGDAWWWRSYFKVFLLQAVVAWIVTSPIYAAMRAPGPPALTAWDVIGLLVFAVGLGFEAVADHQLARFKADPANRGQVLDQGLWRYSRHPNYFGEAVLWWGLGIIALGTPGGWLGLVGPALITFLLLRVSGVTMLERQLEDTKPGYKEYVRRTSAFVPLPPK